MLVPVLVGAAFLVAGVVALRRGASTPRLAVALLRTRPSRVADLMSDVPDRVCLVGTVEPTDGGTVRGPFSGRDAVALDYEVQEYESQYNAATRTATGSWEPIHGGLTDRPFVLADGSGRVRVAPAGATYSLGVDTRIEVDGGDRPPERIERYVRVSDAVDSEDSHLSVGPFDLATGEDRRYVERRLEPGDRVLVLGRPVRARGDVGAVNVEVRAADGAPLLVADGDRWPVLGRLVVGSLTWLLFGAVFVALGVGIALVGLGGLG